MISEIGGVSGAGSVSRYPGSRKRQVYRALRSQFGGESVRPPPPRCVECDDSLEIPDDDGVTRPCPWCTTDSQDGGDVSDKKKAARIIPDRPAKSAPPRGALRSVSLESLSQKRADS